MHYPNFSWEKRLLSQGYQNIVGIDEVGRGAWAGPLVAVAAMIVTKKTPYSIAKLKVKDSKLLSEKNRERIFVELSQQVVWSAGVVSHLEIDKLGMTRANVLVIKRAIKKLAVKPDYLLLDKVSGFSHPKPFASIIKGDRKILTIAVASILAKVTRDRIMRRYHHQFPDYYFHRHKGYGTKLHQKCLAEHGVCRIHRQSFQPISNLPNLCYN